VDAGWDVTILEANDAIGGAVRSSNEVDSAFVHDTFSSFYPLATVSPAIKGLNLGDYGLEWSNPPSPVGNPLRAGDWALVHPDRGRNCRKMWTENIRKKCKVSTM